MKMSPFFVQLGRILVGYVVGAIAFGIVGAIGVTAIDTTPGLNAIILNIGVLALLASIFAIPAAATFIVYSEWRGGLGVGVYAGTGGIAGGIMLLIFLRPSMSYYPESFLMFFILVTACAASGLTYWAIAGRHAGSWREATPPSK